MGLSATTIVVLLLMGFGIGTVSGVVGIGGGILVIPLLMFFFGFTQQKANGTSLAMLLPPIGILAVVMYAKAGNINWAFAGLLAVGFTAGAYVGGWMVNRGLLNATAMRITFALFLAYVAAALLFRSGGHARAALETSLMVGGFAATYFVMRLLGRKWMRTPSWGDMYRDKLRHAVPYDYEI